jgi:hypothetical protein
MRVQLLWRINKLVDPYRGPLLIHSTDRPDFVQLRDLTNNKLQFVHTSSLRIFKHPAEMTEEEAAPFAAASMDVFYVGRIRASMSGRNPKKWQYRLRCLGYEEVDDTWLRWSLVKSLRALDGYDEEGPDCKVD